MENVEKQQFRRALGQFATGVTVVTTLDADGEPVGITVNSFNSVSLEPPLVLWSISRDSGKRAAFEARDAFTVNVLAADQADVSASFAKSGNAAFGQTDWQPGIDEVPLLPDCAARFQCRKVYQYDGGDHIIIVGRVERFDETGRDALVFHRGKYGIVEARNAEDNPPGGYEDDFLMALLMRATYEFVEPFKQRLAELDLSEAEIRVLTFLNDFDGRDLAALSYGTMLPAAEVAGTVESLRSQGLVAPAEDASREIVITADGRGRVLPVLAIAKAHEADVLARYSPQQVYRLKRELKRLVELSRS